MAVDMVYDILRNHNPVMAFMTEGRDLIGCSGFHETCYNGNGHYGSDFRLRLYRPSHGSAEEGTGSKNFHKFFGSKR